MKQIIFSIWSHLVMTLFGLALGWVSCDYMYKVVLSERSSRRRNDYCSYRNYHKESE